MRNPDPVRHLTAVPIAPLLNQVLALPESTWDEDPFRQQAFAVHVHTRSIRFMWTALDSWPHVQAQQQPRFAEFAPNLAPIVTAAVHHLGRPLTVMNAMLARLDPGQHILAHRDVSPFFGLCHRMHVPVLTNPDVVFSVDHVNHYLKAGQLYEIDNRRLHAVVNHGQSPRIHLIFDLFSAAVP